MTTRVGERPQLIVVYGYRSLNALQLAEAARDLCDLIWLVDAGDEAAMAVRPLLERSGEVVEALGYTASAAAEALRPFRPDGIVTFYDTGMEHVAAIAAELGLPFNSVATARQLEDKFHQREALRAGGLPTPAVVVVSTAEDTARIRELAERVAYPAVLKPRRASGSWHTFVVASADELVARVAAIGADPAEELIVEGYIPDGPPMPGGFEADYVSVETVIAGGEIIHLAVTGRFPLVEPLRETGFFIPSTLDEASTAAVLEVASAALRALSVESGCAHTEIKLSAGGFRVIEINGRVGGGVPEMLRLAAGVDIIKLTMRAALGARLEASAMPRTDRVAYRFFYQPPASARRLLALDGVDLVAQRDGVADVYLHVAPGSQLDSSHGTRTYLFAVVGEAADHAGVLAMDEFLATEVKAVYET